MKISQMTNWMVVAAFTTILSGALLAQGGGNGSVSASIIGASPGLTIGGVASSSASWTVSQSNVSLSSQNLAQTEVQLQLQGLVIASGPGVGTTGGIHAVLATVICGGSGGMVVANTPAATFSAGNAQIQANVTLPGVCRAPVVLVRAFNPQTLQPGAFIASTGLASAPNNNDPARDESAPETR